MRIFVAGASGVIGIRLLPLMVAEGHVVAGMTRTQGKVELLRAAGATPVLCDLFDLDALVSAVRDFCPDLLMHQVTDLPDDVADLPGARAANSRVRSEGTRNLLAAAHAASVRRVVAQSVSWFVNPVIEAHEGGVLAAGGTVLRYGQFYGPGTYYEGEPPAGSRIHIDAAARRTLPFLQGPPGVFTLDEATPPP